MMTPIRVAFVFAMLFTCGISAANRQNDDSCDIATLPAATLLLPYFEVDINSQQTTARTTLFTIVNTSSEQHTARVTIWTDLAYPVATFNIVLTGYDVQSVNLYDTIARGRFFIGDPAEQALCGATSANIPPLILADLRTALTIGRTQACGANAVGLTHSNAIGYVTIDTVATCGTTMPNDPAYYSELLYDNVLTGDYETIDPNPTTGNFAGGDPLVHIRAIPEGGPAGIVAKTNLPYTFYDLYTPRGTNDFRAMDRRQPLPHAFIARFIQGGTGAFSTNLRIWREGLVPPGAACADYKANVGTAMKVSEIMRFDEHENPTLVTFAPILVPTVPILPATSSLPTSGSIIPPLGVSGDLGGFIYLNLDAGTSPNKTSKNAARAKQNWVVVSMQAEGRYQTSFGATPLGNGCSPAPEVRGTIGPAPNKTP